MVPFYCLLLKSFRDTFIEKSISAWEIFVLTMTYVARFMIPVVIFLVVYGFIAGLLIVLQITGEPFAKVPAIGVAISIVNVGWDLNLVS